MKPETGKNDNKKYWFTIEPYVHISLKKDSLLLYNTLSGKALEYHFPEEGKSRIPALFEALQSNENLRVISLTGMDILIPEISSLINDTRKYYMSDLIDADYSKGKPVQMKPEVTIVKDVDKLKNEYNRSGGEDIMEYLTEISLYINSSCKLNCLICDEGYKQFPCCTSRKNTGGILDTGKIKDLFSLLSGTPIRNINILGGDIFTQTDFKDLTAFLNRLKVKKTFYNHYLNFQTGSDNIKWISPISSFMKIPVTFPLEPEHLKSTFDTVAKSRIRYEFIFIIQNEREYLEAEEVVKLLQIQSYSYQPFFSGENLEFFKENVFVGKEEILNAKPSMRDIYINTAVNRLDFGRLTVFNNGDIYANTNEAKLGVLGEVSIHEVMYREILQGKSWRRVRGKVTPCNDCNFQSLCPPLSNYNHAIGKNDLCHISE